MDVFVAMPEGPMRESFFPPDLRAHLDALGDVTWHGDETHPEPGDLPALLAGVDVLVTGWGSPTVDADAVAAADDLSLVAHTGGSVADLVTEAVYDAGVDVVSANDVMARLVAEHVVGATVAHRRGIPGLDRAMKRGERGDDVEIRTLRGADVGLVGLGTIGRYVLDHLRAFDPSVAVYDPYLDDGALADYPFAERASLDEAMDSEVVSVHASRTPETVGMLGADELAAMPDGAVFVNTARAELVVEAAMMDELRSGRVSAVLDVFHEEPLPADHELRELENVLLTPHVGGSRIREPLGECVVEEVARFERGEDLRHRVPREQWALMTR